MIEPGEYCPEGTIPPTQPSKKSYYDEYQKSIFSGNVIESKEHTLNLEKVDEEISEWEIMKEILNISINSSKDLMKNENLYKRKTFIK